MISKEQAETIKKQLIDNLEYFPEEKRDFIQKKVMQMDEKELFEFLKQNKLIQDQQQSPVPTQSPPQPTQTPTQPQQQCLFCSILQDKIPTYKIDENKTSLAILEINPISKGHSLIIPKKHDAKEKIPTSSFSLAKKIAKKIKSKFKPIDVKISVNQIMGHSLIEVIPFYDDTDPNKKQKAPEEELKKLQNKLEKKTRKKTRKKSKSLPKLKPRIP